MPKAYSYLRFSTPEQEAGDSQRRQIDKARAYARRHDLTLDEQLTFQDLGVSAFRGANVEMGALRAFIEAAEGGLIEKGSYLLVESFDRLSRENILAAQALFYRLLDLEITLVTLMDGRAYSKDSVIKEPFQLIMAIVIMIRAHEESSTKSSRLKSAWQAKRRAARKEGKIMTSRVPAWLERAGEDMRVDPDRSAVVKRVFEMTLAGVGQHKIAETFNREGVPVFGRGTQWHRSYIAKLLSSPAVVGTLVPHSLEFREGKKVRKAHSSIPGYYPAVVDEDTYQSVQAMRQGSRSPQRGRHAGRPVRNILGCLARCPKCDSTMTRVSKGPNKGKPFLVCTKAKSGAGCKYLGVHYGPVEAALIREAPVFLGTIPAGENAAKFDKEIERVEVELERNEEALWILRDELVKGPSPTISEEIRKIGERIPRLEEGLYRLYTRAEAIAGPLMRKRADELVNVLGAQKVDRGAANRLLRQLFSGVVVDYESGDLRFQWLQGGESCIDYSMLQEMVRLSKETGGLQPIPHP